MERLRNIALQGLGWATKTTKEMNLEYMSSENFTQEGFTKHKTGEDRRGKIPGDENVIEDFYGEDKEGKTIVYVLDNAHLLVEEVERLHKGLEELSDTVLEYLMQTDTSDSTEFSNKELVSVSNKITAILQPNHKFMGD